MSKAELRNKIQHNLSFHSTIENVDNFFVRPLPDSQAVTCYYVRNNGGFFGKDEPYLLIPSADVPTDYTNYWYKWQQNIADFHIIDVDTANHFTMLGKPKSYQVILTLCKKIYSEEGLTK